MPIPANQIGLGGPEIIIILVLLGILAIWIYSLIHCIRNKSLSDRNRTIGIVLIAILGVLGSLVYLFIPREGSK